MAGVTAAPELARGIPADRPQPHGGALRTGNPGNSGGYGNERITIPTKLVPKDARDLAREALPKLVRMALKMSRDKKLPPHERMRAAAFVHEVSGKATLSDLLPGGRKPRATVTTVSPASARAKVTDLTQDDVMRSAPMAAAPTAPSPE